jgi:hypothetical protein
MACSGARIAQKTTRIQGIAKIRFMAFRASES